MFKSVIKYTNWLVILALVIHFTIKDQFYCSSILFYALPLPIISLLAIITALFSKKVWRIALFVIGLVSISIWLNRSYVQNDVNSSLNSRNIEIVLWNAGHDRGLKEAVTANGNIPDVLVLIETDSSSSQYAFNHFSDFYFYRSNEEIFVFSKEPISIKNEIISEDNTSILSFETLGINFYAVDISASILNNRRDAFEFLKPNIENDKKTIVLGDFNTPYESVHFNYFKENFNHAFSEKGNGFRETWFWNIPLLSLDHIWISKNLEILKTEKINTWVSDHSMIKMAIE